LKKAILIIISAIIVLIVGGYLYLKIRKSKDFEPLIKAKLQQLVRDASDSLYVLNMDKIEVDVVGAKVKVHNATLSIDSSRLNFLLGNGTAPEDVYKASLSDLTIDGLDISDLLNKKNIDLDTLALNNPTLEIYHPVNKRDTIIKERTTLYSRIQKSLGHFTLKELSVSNMNFVDHNLQQEQEKRTTFKNVLMKFSDIEIDSLTQYDTTRFLYAKHAAIYVPGYIYRTPDSLYLIKADTLTLLASEKLIDIHGLALVPRYSKPDFAKHLKFYKDRYDIKFESASFKNVDWYRLFLGEGFISRQATFSNGTMEVYADKNVPPSPKSKIGNYPHQLLMRLNFPVAIDTLLIKNFEFTYGELNPKTQKTGEVTWTDIDGRILNITNVKEKIAANKMVTVSAQSKLYNTGSFGVVFNFDLTKVQEGNFTVDVNVGEMDGKALNQASQTLGLFEVNSLSIKKLKAHIIANNYSAHSSVLFVYDDLKITALKKDDDSKQLKKRKFLSFVANTFVINKSNKIDDAQPKYVSYPRDPHRSFFSLIWKSLLNGIKSTAS
jgi:hypothetical protein